MTELTELLIDLAVIAIFIGGIAQFRTPRGARRGNLTAALAFAIALALLVYRNTVGHTWIVVAAFLIGGGFGYVVSARISMTHIPSLVAFQNGAGGGAACLVSFVELTRAGAELSTASVVFGFIGLVIGGATFAGSIVAGGKLASWFGQRPTSLPGHNLLLLVLIAGGAALAVFSADGGRAATAMAAGVAMSALALGVLFAIRVGGADMPVLISFLNTCSGLAAAFVGVAVGNQMLIAAGAMVGSSGLILTLVMARAMNRRISSILTGGQLTDGGGDKPAGTVTPAADASDMRGDTPGGSPEAASTNLAEAGADVEPGGATAGGPDSVPGGSTGDVGDGEPTPGSGGAIGATVAGGMSDAAAAAGPRSVSVPSRSADPPATRARRALAGATSVIIVPGYGMALAQAQGEVAALATKLEDAGKLVRFAVHPVAGRMPGHMHVLLAEADVEYEKLFEMDAINDEFASTDVAIVVGACDVVNPAAITAEDTPISGMPILRAHEAGTVIVCNLDDKPGYSGVPNPLYDEPDVILLFGDAKETVASLIGPGR